MTTDPSEPPYSVADKLVVAELAQLERRARDRKSWDELLDCYHPGWSRIFISWFDGDAPAFVAASRAMAKGAGGHAIHYNGPTFVRLNGDRALAETPCTILMRRMVDGVECDLTSYCRNHSRVERYEGRWRICTLVSVYEKNTLVATIPGLVPTIDRQSLASLRASYNFQSYFRVQQGKSANDDRPGIDRPDLVDRLLEHDERWLAGENSPLGIGGLS